MIVVSVIISDNYFLGICNSIFKYIFSYIYWCLVIADKRNTLISTQYVTFKLRPLYEYLSRRF